MTKDEFLETRKAEIIKDYKALRKAKKNRKDSLDELAVKYGLKPASIVQIMSDSKYSKRNKKEIENTVPKE